ncbi:hypothetical protein AGMMS50284_5900 [Clostridia bacterium]|nr:hypothetical protein AGMMS50284_5900 [Clostridia bacterium]
MFKKRKKFKITLIVISFFIVIGTITIALNYSNIAHELGNIALSREWKKDGGVKDFEKYKEDYDVAAKIAYDYYLEHPEEGLMFNLWQPSGDDYCKYSVFIKDENASTGREIISLPLTEEQNDSLKRILEKSFVSNETVFRLDSVVVYKTHIAFKTFGGRYSLIYSIDGSIPPFVSSPAETSETYFEKLDDHWYNGRKK